MPDSTAGRNDTLGRAPEKWNLNVRHGACGNKGRAPEGANSQTPPRSRSCALTLAARARYENTGWLPRGQAAMTSAAPGTEIALGECYEDRPLWSCFHETPKYFLAVP